MGKSNKPTFVEKIAGNPKLSKTILKTGGKMLNSLVAKYGIADIRWGVDANSPNDSVVIKITCEKPATMIEELNKFSQEITEMMQQKKEAGEID